MCRTGGRSQNATQFLQAQGFENVTNVSGGIVAWHAAGLPTSSGAIRSRARATSSLPPARHGGRTCSQRCLLCRVVGPGAPPARPDRDDADWYLPLHVRDACRA